MKTIQFANRVFSVLQLIWFLVWIAAMLWAFISTDASPEGQSSRGEVSSFRLHTANLLAMLYILCSKGSSSNTKWIGLVPLFVVQFIIGIFAIVDVGLFSANLSKMHPLYEFTIYAVGTYQLVLLMAGILFYGYQWIVLKPIAVRTKKQQQQLPSPSIKWHLK